MGLEAGVDLISDGLSLPTSQRLELGHSGEAQIAA